MAAGPDLDGLRQALAPVQRAAEGLPWAEDRPWTTRSHVWLEEDLPVVDLHDLGVKQARLAVELLAERADPLGIAAACFVVGRGRHSIGRKRLGPAVKAALQDLVHSRGGSYSPQGDGRYVLVLDRSRAPRRATGALSPTMWVGIALFALAAAFILPPVGLPLCLALLSLGIRALLRRRRR